MNYRLKLDIVFIVLNYNIYTETVNCIESIRENIDSNNWRIILVDNASKNEIKDKLLSQYYQDNKVELLLLKENIGFAKGNNVGIEYARNKYDSKYVCCLNNDTVLKQQNFIKKLDDIYFKSKAAVIGPKIILRDGSLQPTLGKLQNKLYYNDLLKKYMNCKYITFCVKDAVKCMLFGKLIVWLKNRKKLEMAKKEQKNIILHGCCLIFTPQFFTKLKGFVADTFLFREEELLFNSILCNELTNIYSPEIEIEHLEDISTLATCVTNYDKFKFYKNNQINSLKILINKLEK